MSELNNIAVQQRNLRSCLLATTSLLCLAAAITLSDDDAIARESRPTVWIELGYQVERVDSGIDPYAPAMVEAFPGLGFTSSSAVQRPPGYSMGGAAKILFEPSDTGWTFSAAVRFGRSNKSRHVHEQTPATPVPITLYSGLLHLTAFHKMTRFGDTASSQSETHAIMDFQAGKDVGLGIGDATSLVSLGIRYAQLNSRSRADIHSEPNYELNFQHVKYYDLDAASADLARSFQGIGPSLSWNVSMPLFGADNTGKLSLDWGFTGAVLFGRQKVTGSHETTVTQHCSNEVWGTPCNLAVFPLATNAGYIHSNFHRSVAPVRRSHSVVVPNIDLLAGVSYRIEDFKVAAGYRASLFFGAMDGGVDVRNTRNRDFYGPFATVSIGLGN